MIIAVIRVPKTHDLDRLASEVGPHMPLIADLIDAVRSLTDWGWRTRYPDQEAWIGPNPTEIGEALSDIGALRTAVVATLA
jgi:HEPN domain-containing protein